MVLMEVKIQILVSLVIIPCRLLFGYTYQTTLSTQTLVPLDLSFQQSCIMR